MTAISIINQASRVSLVGDAGHYDLDHTLVGSGSKITELPRTRAAIGTRGGLEYGALIADQLAVADSFDELIALAPIALRQARAVLSLAFPGAPPAYLGCKVSVIGWDNGQGRAFTLTTEDFTVADVPYLNAGPCPLDGGGDLLALVAGDHRINDESDWDALDTESAALRLIDAQRHAEISEPELGAHGAYIVGAWAEILTISAGGVSRRRLCEWPDPIGEVLKPHVRPRV